MRSRTVRSTPKLQNIICERLRHISYNRWAQYWNSRYSAVDGISQHTFLPDTYWEDIEAVYMFDRRIRNLLFDAIARIEISLRISLSHQWAKVSGTDKPHARTAFYELKRPFTSKKKDSGYEYMMNCAEVEFNRAKKRKNIRAKLRHVPDVSHLPVWEFIDFCTFGPLSNLISIGLKDRVVIRIAHTFGFRNIQEFRSVIFLLHDIRNTCAHQGRVWNRPWLTAQSTPHVKAQQTPYWDLVWNPSASAWESGQGHTLVSDLKTTAVALTYCCYILKYIAPKSKWKDRCKALLLAPENAAFIAELGFNEHWWSHPLWR